MHPFQEVRKRIAYQTQKTCIEEIIEIRAETN